MMIDTRDRNIAALTIWAEARSETEEGQAAVAWVILHRAHNPRWWGRGGVADVCLSDWQFSCWNPSDPQRARMLGMLVGGDTVSAVLTLDGAKAVARQMGILDKVLRGEIPDPTDGATHYLTRAAYAEHQASRNRWAKGKKPREVIGAHLFFGPRDLGETPITPWAPPVVPTPRPVEPAPSGGFWAALIRIIASIFGGNRNA